MNKICLVPLLFLCVISGCIMSGCQNASQEGKRGKDWEYTVVPTADCPEELKEEIDKKKVNAFQMTYDDGEFLYAAVGYGEQEKGGFSIQVLGLYEKGSSLCFETSLNGPEEDEVVSHKASYPYLVIKTEKTDKQVIFDS